jgi:NAD(P)-dependent dehydrogenase (short-subunit alcohol dehydrogenase family)
MNPIYDFKGQVALVTGAAKGMGLATARMFAGSGASVVLADIDGDLAAKEAERIVLEGGTAIGVACDVADEAQVAAMVGRAVAEYGRLDMAFNNVGIQVPPSDAADETIENFERVTAVNQRGVWAGMKHELRVMRDQGRGAIVNCSSLGGLVGLPQTRSLSRHQARRARNDQERRCRICATRHPHQRGAPARSTRRWLPTCLKVRLKRWPRS